MGVSGLAKVVLWSHDMKKTLAFYSDLLELELISPPEMPIKFMKVGQINEQMPQMVVIVPHPDQEVFPRDKQKRALHHLALSVDRDDFDSLRQKCIDKGLEVRGGVHPVLKDVQTFYVDDPDGNEVEVIAPH